MKLRKLPFRLPLAMAAAFGTLWSGLYAFMGLLHGMPAMFDAEFPFLISSFLGIHSQGMTPMTGAAVAFADGASVAFVLGVLLMLLYRTQFDGKEE